MAFNLYFQFIAPWPISVKMSKSYIKDPNKADTALKCMLVHRLLDDGAVKDEVQQMHTKTAAVHYKLRHLVNVSTWAPLRSPLCFVCFLSYGSP